MDFSNDFFGGLFFGLVMFFLVGLIVTIVIVSKRRKKKRRDVRTVIRVWDGLNLSADPRSNNPFDGLLYFFDLLNEYKLTKEDVKDSTSWPGSIRIAMVDLRNKIRHEGDAMIEKIAKLEITADTKNLDSLFKDFEILLTWVSATNSREKSYSAFNLASDKLTERTYLALKTSKYADLAKLCYQQMKHSDNIVHFETFYSRFKHSVEICGLEATGVNKQELQSLLEVHARKQVQAMGANA